MSYLVENRTVWTWEPDGWPGGVITGVPDGHGGFRIEHVALFPHRGGLRDLLALVDEGLSVAWDRYQYVTFHLPRTFPPAQSLRALAERRGFTCYAEDTVCEHFILRHR